MTTMVVTLDDPTLAELRRRVLHPERAYPFPTRPRAATADLAPRLLARDAARHGVAAVRLDAPLDAAGFLAVGGALGRLVAETAPAVQSRVTAGHILNLVTDVAPTPDVDLQPFAAGVLLLHTESSARPPRSRPRYVLLQCRQAASRPVDGQTVVISYDEVAARLGPAVLGLLSKVRYRGARHPLLRRARGRAVFSFRDPGEQPLELDVDRSVPADRVAPALTELCAAMYRPEATYAIPWEPGLLALVDNRRVFHGRTRSGTVDTGRHLQRLRIAPPDRPVVACHEDGQATREVETRSVP
ncbi:TauD/TfdA family dioxygenase [Krasilnikovia sp. MM14-A1259]|uniref:TauD/TfdA family dioxygenase n=1 Tax=Krasilnikovia sp. MM14-A1259 TaxID=3373539 RepID=UPI0038250714